MLRYLNINALRYNLIYTPDQIYLESIELNSNEYTEFNMSNRIINLYKNNTAMMQLAFSYFSIAFLQIGDFIGAGSNITGYDSDCNNLGLYNGVLLFQDIGSGGLYTMTRGLIDETNFNNEYYDTLISGYTEKEKKTLSCKKEFIHKMLIHDSKDNYNNLKNGIYNVLSKDNFNEFKQQLISIYDKIEISNKNSNVLKKHFEAFTDKFINFFNNRLHFFKKKYLFNDADGKEESVKRIINNMVNVYNRLPNTQREDTTLPDI